MTCNDCTVVSTKERNSINLDSVLASCNEVKEILTFLESYCHGSFSASIYIKMSTDELCFRCE